MGYFQPSTNFMRIGSGTGKNEQLKRGLYLEFLVGVQAKALEGARQKLGLAPETVPRAEMTSASVEGLIPPAAPNSGVRALLPEACYALQRRPRPFIIADPLSSRCWSAALMLIPPPPWRPQVLSASIRSPFRAKGMRRAPDPFTPIAGGGDRTRGQGPLSDDETQLMFDAIDLDVDGCSLHPSLSRSLRNANY